MKIILFQIYLFHILKTILKEMEVKMILLLKLKVKNMQKYYEMLLHMENSIQMIKEIILFI